MVAANVCLYSALMTNDRRPLVTASWYIDVQVRHLRSFDNQAVYGDAFGDGNIAGQTLSLQETRSGR